VSAVDVLWTALLLAFIAGVGAALTLRARAWNADARISDLRRDLESLGRANGKRGAELLDLEKQLEHLQDALDARRREHVRLLKHLRLAEKTSPSVTYLEKDHGS
jgi:predicted  nucleic acid-binding Zn-ribbon protein